jgi:biopolymer transport protein ExbD
MLTAKMKPTETVVIDTPSSISETKLPDAGTLTIFVDPEGRIFLDMVGNHTRFSLIKEISDAHSLGLSQQDMVTFSNLGMFGVPRNQLGGYIREDVAGRAEFKVEGIPVDTADINKSELADWVHRARLAQFRMKQEGKVTDEYVIVVKADKNTPYPAVQKVINTLTDINVNKFNLITSMEGAEKKE